MWPTDTQLGRGKAAYFLPVIIPRKPKSQVRKSWHTWDVAQRSKKMRKEKRSWGVRCKAERKWWGRGGRNRDMATWQERGQSRQLSGQQASPLPRHFLFAPDSPWSFFFFFLRAWTMTKYSLEIGIDCLEK